MAKQVSIQGRSLDSEKVSKGGPRMRLNSEKYSMYVSGPGRRGEPGNLTD